MEASAKLTSFGKATEKLEPPLYRRVISACCYFGKHLAVAHKVQMELTFDPESPLLHVCFRGMETFAHKYLTLQASFHNNSLKEEQLRSPSASEQVRCYAVLQCDAGYSSMKKQ